MPHLTTSVILTAALGLAGCYAGEVADELDGQTGTTSEGASGELDSLSTTEGSAGTSGESTGTVDSGSTDADAQQCTEGECANGGVCRALTYRAWNFGH